MPTKAGTAYVDIVGNFAPLNRQIARMGSISGQASKSFSRSMKTVSREAEGSRRKVASLSRQISGVGEAAQGSSRQATRAFRQIEASSAQALRALRAVEAAQRRAATGARPGGPTAGRVRQAGARGQATTTVNPIVAGLVPTVSQAAVEAAAAAAARHAASRVGTIGAARGTYSTYGLARSFGRGRAASTVAEVGARASSALSIGKNFAGAFAKGIGPGLASAGVERILTSALKGDMKSAGFQAGGALVGGVLGSFAGPAGTMIGVGLGSMAGDLLSGLFSSGKKTLTLQQRLAASAKQVTFAYRGLRASSQTLARSGEALIRSHGRARKASREVVAAERQLAKARRQFGPNSRQASQAEQNLSAARQRSAKASKTAQRAERLHGIERKIQKEILRGTILEERHKLVLLQKNEKQLRKELSTAYKNERSHQVLVHLKGKLAKNQRELTDTQKKQNDTLREATQTIGPKYANHLKNASGELLRAGRQARQAQKDIEKPTRAFTKAGEAGENSARRAKRGYDRLGAGLGAFAGVAAKNMGKASGVMKDFDSSTNRALGAVRTGTNQTLAGLGVATVDFAVRKQIGGEIVPGSGEGDSYRTTLPTGSFVLNKKATKAFGFRRGGQVPVLLEPGERTFLPHEVRAIGRPALEAANAAIPRFATGGSLDEPHLQGPEPLRRGGQGAIGKTFKAAKRYVDKHRPTGGIGATGPAPKGFRELMKNWKDGHPRWNVWQVGLLLQKMGYHVAEHPRFGGIQGAHDPDGFHYIGRAIDVNADSWPGGEMAALDKLHAQLVRIPHSELLWRDEGHWDHLHYAFQKGGPIRKLSTGGFVGNINRIYPEHNSAYGDWGGETLPSFVVAALAEEAGRALGVDVPGRTMEQVTRGESGSHKRNSARPGATGIDEGGTKGLGLWMITTHFNDARIAKYGGQAAMRNPVRNAAAMAEVYDAQGLGAWYGTGSVTGTNTHYEGKYNLSNALGGKTFSQALGIAPRGGEKGGKDHKAEYEAKLAAAAAEVGRADSLPVKQSKLWKLIRLWGRLGVFDQAERMHILQAVQSAAAATDAGDSVKILGGLARFTENHGEVTGKPAEGSKPLVEGIAQAQARGKEKRKKRVEKQRKQVQRLQKKVADNIARRASFAELVAQIAALRKQADDQEVYIGEVVTLEPEEITQAYVELEESAYKTELTKLLGWRNTVVGARDYATAEIGRFQQQIAEIEALNIEVGDATAVAGPKKVGGAKAVSGKGKKGKGKLLGGLVAALAGGGMALGQARSTEGPRGIGKAQKANRPGVGPAAYAKQKYKIPLLEQAIRDATEIRDETWREELEEISPHSMTGILAEIPPDPVPGAFGGRVFEVQSALKSLGLKGDGGDKSAEEAALYRELLIQSEQRNIVRGIEEDVFGSMPPVGQGFRSGGLIGVMPPYGGKAHVGAVVPGPPGQERTMVVKSGEGIFTPEQMAALGAGGEIGPVRVNVNGDIVSSHPDPVEVMLGDRRLAAEIRKITNRDNRRQARGAGRGLATPGVFSR